VAERTAGAPGSPSRVGGRDTPRFPRVLAAVVTCVAVFFTFDDLMQVVIAVRDPHTALDALRFVLCTAAMALVCWFPRLGAALSWAALAASLASGTIGLIQVVMVVVALAVTATTGTAFACVNIGILFLGIVATTVRWPDSAGLLFWLGTAFLAAGVALGVIVRWVLRSRIEQRRQRELLAQVRQQAEDARRDERERLAHDMHDYVAHELTVIVATLASARLERAQTAAAPGSAASARLVEVLDTVEHSSRTALDELRRVLRVLGDDASDGQDVAGAPHEHALSAGGLSPLVTHPVQPQPPIETMVRDAAQDLAAIQDRVDIAIDPSLGTLVLPGEQAALLGRFLTEGVTNVVKHGGLGAHVVLDVRHPPDREDIRVRLANSVAPTGTSPPRDSTGMGIPGLHREAQKCGCSIAAGPLDESDLRWELVLDIPRGRTDSDDNE
jgi:signal transduction histidine kinase